MLMSDFQCRVLKAFIFFPYLDMAKNSCTPTWCKGQLFASSFLLAGCRQFSLLVVIYSGLSRYKKDGVGYIVSIKTFIYV